MPGLTGPLFSLGASGTLAKAITYSRWKGVKYARQRVIPQNPKSTTQVFNRDAFKNLNSMFGYLTATQIESYNAQANNRPLTPRNAFVQNNAFNLETNDDYSALLLYGHRGQLNIPGIPTLTDAGAHTINAAGVPGDPPPAGGTNFTYAAAILEGDHSTPPPWDIVEDFSTNNPYSIDLVMPSSGTYHVCVVHRCLLPDGITVLFSASQVDDIIIA